MKIKESKIALQYLYNAGCNSAKELSKLTCIPLRTVQRDLAKLQRGISLERKEGSGRSNKLDVNDKKKIIKLVCEDDMRTSSYIKERIKEDGGPTVSSSTIRRCLNKSGYHCFVPKKDLNLTDTHIQNRLEWCKTRWGSWVFTDESKFELSRLKNKRWGTRKKKNIPVSKFSPSLMVWGGICSKSKTILVKIRGSVNSEKYQEILEQAESSIRGLFLERFKFQQDGARCHISESTMKWFNQRKWDVSAWPSNSADLNPIENVWAVMKREVERKRPKGLKELEKIVDEVWDNFPLEKIKSLCHNMKKRIQLCIDNEGKKIDY